MDDADKEQLETIVGIMNEAVEQARAYVEDEEQDHSPECIQVHVDYLGQKIAGVERTAASICRRKQVEISTEPIVEVASAFIRDLKLMHARGMNQRRAAEAAAVAAAAAEKKLAVERASQLQVIVKKPPLPPMQIPRFAGDPMQYANFTTVFDETIDKNDTLAPSQKLLYLQSYVDGEAKKLIGKLLVSDANYAVAQDALRLNFGQPKQTVTTLYQRLHEVQRCRNEPFSIRDTFNEIEAIFKMLEHAGVDVNTSDYLCQEAYQKFPFTFIRQIVRTPNVGLKELRGLLQNEVEMLVQLTQTAGYVHPDVHRSKQQPGKSSRKGAAPAASGQQQSAAQPNQSSEQGKAPNVSAAPAVTETANTSSQKSTSASNSAYRGRWSRQTESSASQEQQKDQPQRSAFCPFCRESHHAEECQKFTTAKSRTEQLGTQRCCKCFRQSHEGQPCIRNMQCKYCHSYDHNRALCPQKYPDAGKCLFTDKSIEEETKTGLFMTLLAKASNPETKKTAWLRIMIDQACNRTSMTEEAAERLGVNVKDKKLLGSKGMGDCPVQPITRGTVDIFLHDEHGDPIPVPVHLTSRIADDVPVYSVEHFRMQYPDHGYLIPSTGEGRPVDIILGTDVLLRFLTLHRSAYINESCQLLSTKFGYLIMAEKPATNIDQDYHSYFTRSEDIVKLM